MKKSIILILIFIVLLTISSCRSIYRDFQDDELEVMAMSHFNFDSYETFKIIDVDTADYLTTKNYQNSGVVIGVKNNEYKMIFVPRKMNENPYILDKVEYFNLNELYNELSNFIEESIFLEDYGGLSIAIYPYVAITEKYSSLNFDSQIFYIVSTDEDIYYANYIEESLVIFDKDYDMVFS